MGLSTVTRPCARRIPVGRQHVWHAALGHATQHCGQCSWYLQLHSGGLHGPEYWHSVPGGRLPPIDAANDNKGTKRVSINFVKTSPTLTWATTAATTYGRCLGLEGSVAPPSAHAGYPHGDGDVRPFDSTSCATTWCFRRNDWPIRQMPRQCSLGICAFRLLQAKFWWRRLDSNQRQRAYEFLAVGFVGGQRLILSTVRRLAS